ncbi:MAG: DUF308 domain-containing protein [Oscillospiraceae bacterium]|nr:DUF308 domain-containing protein [Oscillospiraceae bacterium]
MKFLKENITNLVICLCEIVIGIVLIVNPVGFTSGVIIAMGIFLLILGIANAIGYFRTPPEVAARGQGLTLGIIYLAIGIFCVANSRWFVAVFPLLTVLYGVFILVMGLVKIQWMVNLIRLKRKQWFVALVSAIISLGAAFIIFNNPFATTAALWTFSAIMLIVDAILDIITIFYKNKVESDAKAEEEILKKEPAVEVESE